MIAITGYPIVLFVVSFVVLALSAGVGRWIQRGRLRLQEGVREDFDIILASTLTLLGLIIGFSFSMAVARYDLRKNYEEAEANAIGTEYLRADLLTPADAANVRRSLRGYLDHRILFYASNHGEGLDDVDARTVRLQGELWAAVRASAASQPTPLSALVVAGMNDVLNAQGYVQAAYWNLIPAEVWLLMAATAIAGNLLLGYGARGGKNGRSLMMVVPLTVSLSFSLIADIDSPRGGLVRVSAQNLANLANSIRTP